MENNTVVVVGNGWNSKVIINYGTKDNNVSVSYLQRDVKRISLTETNKKYKFEISFTKDKPIKFSSSTTEKLDMPINILYEKVNAAHNTWCDENDSLGFDKYQLPEELLTELMQPSLKLTQRNAEVAVQIGDQMKSVIDVFTRLKKLMELSDNQ